MMDFKQAIDQFNAGEYYACHDTLEALWLEALDPERKFYQGLLQIAVAYYHLGHQNWRGCVILLGEGLAKLDAFSPTYAGIVIDPFLATNYANLKTLQHLGADQVSQFPLDQIPTLQWVD